MPVSSKSTLLAVMLVVWGPTVAAQSFSDVEKLATAANGLCPPDLIKQLPSRMGYAYSFEETTLYRTAAGAAEELDRKIRPMVPLTCHARVKRAGEDRLLVSVRRQNGADDTRLCGWVNEMSLLQAGGAGEIDDQKRRPKACGQVKALKINEFCEQLKDIRPAEDLPAECSKGSTVMKTPLDAKFVVFNRKLKEGDEASLENIVVPTFRMAQDQRGDVTELGTIRAFSHNAVFEVASGPGRAERFLVGASHKVMHGWIDPESGSLWSSRLAVYPSKTATKPVHDLPHYSTATNKIVVPVMKDVDAQYATGRDFDKWPVLDDNRRVDKNSGLRIAHVGVLCRDASGELCYGAAPPKSRIRQTDVMFLIDGTFSMKSYYGSVARAVKTIAQDYASDPSYRLGAAMYGDFLDASAMALDDPMQWRLVRRPAAIEIDDTFSDLSEAELYIKDYIEDYIDNSVNKTPEAVLAALKQTVKNIRWRDGALRLIVHIADHGDRTEEPPKALLDAMREAKILYLPIPVLGDYRKGFNENFQNLTKNISRLHRTDTGLPLSIPPLTTYGADGKQTANEGEAILNALRAALAVQDNIQQQLLDTLTGTQDRTDSSKDINKLVPGFGSMTQGAASAYLGTSFENLKEGFDYVVAGEGYIEAAPLGAEETNWDYFVALKPTDLFPLRDSFTDLCEVFDSSEAGEVLLANVLDIISILAGDTFERDSSEGDRYFDDRETIPLSTRTILGDGLLDLMDDLEVTQVGSDGLAGTQRIASAKREICRTAALLSLMPDNKRLAKPYDSGRDGDLEWDESKSRYTANNAGDFIWRVEDDFRNSTYYLPLSYLPPALD